MGLHSARVAGLEQDLKILPTQYGGYGYNLLLTGFYVRISRNLHDWIYSEKSPS